MEAKGDPIMEVLASVPEKRLMLIDLANELCVNGQLDYQQAAERGPEVNLAVAEANAYSRTTQDAIRALRDLPARAMG
mgnify:CR=1 FL=1